MPIGRRSGVSQTFTFRLLNKRRLLSAEADQTLTSQECQRTNPLAREDAARRVVLGVSDMVTS